MKVLEINNLSKNYGSIQAVNRLNLDVEEGQIFGILGPNGSGKTTTLGIVLGILRSNSGNFRWFEGQKGEGAAALRHVGSLLETPNFYPYLNAIENLKIVAHIKRAQNVDFQSILTLVNLAHRQKSPFSTYSLGMKQRLAIGATMVGDPSVLIFDEPTNGLDPAGIAEVRQTIQGIAAQGKTIFMASHILDEVEKVCSHVAIIKNGNLLAQGTVGGLLNQDLTIEIGSEDLQILRGCLSDISFVKNMTEQNGYLMVSVESGNTLLDVSKKVFEQGIILTHLTEKKQRLEDEFLKIIAKN